MTRTRNMSDLLDSSGDVKSGALDNVPASNDASALTTGTLPDGRFPTTLPAVSGANLTSLNPANLTGVTSTAAELNILDGVTATASELNILDGVTATAAELNILDGVTATAAELNILDGVTATAAELNYVDGVTSSIQTQIDNINTDLVNDTSPQLGGTLDTNGQAIQFGSSKWTIELSGNNLLFKYNGTAKIKFAEDGEIVTVDDVTAFGTI